MPDLRSWSYKLSSHLGNLYCCSITTIFYLLSLVQISPWGKKTQYSNFYLIFCGLFVHSWAFVGFPAIEIFLQQSSYYLLVSIDLTFFKSGALTLKLAQQSTLRYSEPFLPANYVKTYHKYYWNFIYANSNQHWKWAPKDGSSYQFHWRLLALVFHL